MRISDVLLKILSPTAKFEASREEIPVNPVRTLKRRVPTGNLEGLFVVAAFDTVSKNRLQNFGRRLYYRNPKRFHCLLPYLGHRQKPGAPRPGWQPPAAPKPSPQ